MFATTEYTSDFPDPEDTTLPSLFDTFESFKHAVTHVFFPVELPAENDCSLENNLSLASAACTTAHAYIRYVRGSPEEDRWSPIAKMLNNLQVSILTERLEKDVIITQLRAMETGDILTFFVRNKNTAIILTRRENGVLFESFQVAPGRSAVDEAPGSLICSYPWSAVEMPNKIFDTEDFQTELAKFLSLSDGARSVPDYMTSTLQRLGRPADIAGITKRIRDNVGPWPLTSEQFILEHCWRRSSVWLLIRIAIQMSVGRPSVGDASYKQFILYFICTLARDEKNTNLSRDLLHLMSCKILRRLRKLGPSVSKRISEMAVDTYTWLRKTLDIRWEELNFCQPRFRNPTQTELVRDMKLSLPNSGEYIRRVLSTPDPVRSCTPFHPNHHRRGILEDFLSSGGSFIDEAYDADPDVTVYDIDRSVEQELDDWTANVTSVNEDCVRLEILMDRYVAVSTREDPEHDSIKILTMFEFFVALDKLAVREIPMLIDYFPDIQIAWLEQLCLRKRTSLHRLSCIYQYLVARRSRSHPAWIVPSDKFTEDSFPVRYYNQSPYLQQLKARIEQKVVVDTGQQVELGEASLTGIRDEHQGRPTQQHLLEGVERSASPLPTPLMNAKIVVFELQCPPCFRTWRSAIAQIRHFIDHDWGRIWEKCRRLADVPELRPYLVDRGPPLYTRIHLVYYYPSSSRDSSELRHVTLKSDVDSQGSNGEGTFYRWQVSKEEELQFKSTYYWRSLHRNYVDSTLHTPNGMLAAQADCPTDFSLNEFITFGHLRSGPLLQWLNILRELRSRALNFRHNDVFFLLVKAALQVGPLDPNTGIWIWHQELQDRCFCGALLGELDNLFVDGAGLIDAVFMGTISLLLTRILASSPSADVSEQAIAALRRVRRRTFGWVQDLSYDLKMARTNEERERSLMHMCAACRSTFNVDRATLCQLIHSAEDVDVILSCLSFLHSTRIDYQRLPFHRDLRLAPEIEDIVRGAILADPSDYGLDLAVARIFPTYHPGALRSEPLQYPNTRWLACKTNPVGTQRSQAVHINLLLGELRVDGRPFGCLLRQVKIYPEFQRIFGFGNPLVVPSDLQGMDFMTLAVTSKYKVHLSLQGENLVVRAQCNQTNHVFELVPSGILRKDLPPTLVNNHTHWLNLTTKVIKIRPLGQCWEQSTENWRIECASGSYHAYKGHSSLVDSQSPTWAALSQCFMCLDDESILVTVSSVDTHQSVFRLSVTLPCYGLSFFVNDRKELESRDFKYMVYDNSEPEDQCIQTLFGLKNLLLLRPTTHIAGFLVPEAMIPRLVLIPDGHPDSTKGGVGFSTSSSGSYHTFKVDSELGCLVGDGSARNTRLLAYLHAATSFHKPDPLTCKMGTQAAPDLLQSAGCQSIMQLKALALDKKETTPFESVSEHRFSPWGSTKHPQVNIASEEIQSKYYWGRLGDKPRSLDKRAARRAMHLFPFGPARPMSAEVCNDDLVYKAAKSDPESKNIASALPATSQPRHRVSPTTQYTSNHHTPQITLYQLLSKRPPPELPLCSSLSQQDLHGTSESSEDSFSLDQLFSTLPKTCSAFQREYIALLEASAAADAHKTTRTPVVVKGYINALQNHYTRCRNDYIDALGRLKKCLGPATHHEQVLEQFGHWPPITADILLRCLASTSPINLSARWKKCLIVPSVLDGLEDEFLKELENEQCDGWNPEEHPDWLLIQVQGNFLIRRGQAETAMELISPASRKNTMMQVNMGEGKSSVIIPIVAATLANGEQLVRVIVPKALITQMFDKLVSCLGGLANRPVYYLPFSRTGNAEDTGDCGLQAAGLRRLMSQCMAERGILLLQPVHIVSLKLMGVERQIREVGSMSGPSPNLQKSLYSRITTSLSATNRLVSESSLVDRIFRWSGRSAKNTTRNGTHATNAWSRIAPDSPSEWLSLQKWLHSNVRDILDESDEILHSRFQLIYTVGLEQHMDGYPDRWIITQQVLRLVKEHLHTLSRHHPNSIEYERGPPGSFPRVHIVSTSTICQHLISMIVKDVMAGRLPNFNFQRLPSAALRDAIRSFISDKDVLRVSDTAKLVEEYATRSNQSYLWRGLLLLRGLLSSDILLFALTERRWRVDYGLDQRLQFSTKLAVPYRAKDVPAPNTQFGHPDLTIILTCLAYYYTGLSEEQLRASFEILLDLDDPSAEYNRWIENCKSIPDSLLRLSDINLRSSEQWDKATYPLFSRNQAVVNFYLARVVFPKEAKDFPWKLCGSSWDLGEEREKLVTGFSGTSDGRWLLPLSVIQHDLDHQRGTSANVLAHLLRQERTKDLENYTVTHRNGERQTTHEFLKLVSTQRPEIRILLDVGAQILDLSNSEVAEVWLDIAHDAVAAIYFNENDELTVLTRNGKPHPLSSSPFSQQSGGCVVYLDHPHTRGTDLKLPVGSRAAVTLGPKVTKDALMQGCMRMRKLGHGHSVIFFAPPGVDQSIRAVTGKHDLNVQVTITDVLSWAIHETWADIQHRAPYWAQQGIDHQSRSDAWSRFCNDGLSPTQLSSTWCQPNSKSLAGLYAPRQGTEDFHVDLSAVSGMEQRCKDLGVLSIPRGGLEEEQEREVHREREREREVELPPQARGAKHVLHPDVVAFVKTGIIPLLHSDRAFLPVFTTLGRSTAATHDADVWSPSILATVDFSRTIVPESTKGSMDQYLRPVQWILSSKTDRGPVLILLSPFEANLLIPEIRTSKHVHLHLYAPRTAQRMKPSDDFRLYAIPPLPADWTPPWELIDQLNVFSGQLYLRDHQSYLRLCRFLDIPSNKPPSSREKVRRNLFNVPGSLEEMEITFADSPLPTVMALLAIRTRGRPFDHTHMGKILQGQVLTEKDFEQPNLAVISDNA